ncbi:MAG TPA: DUF2934 domain-containing protein [Nitrospira sp.]
MPGATLIEQRPKVKTQRTRFAAPRQERAIQQPAELRQRIADKAYALYEQRGRREGYALDDWLEAEHLLNQELFDTR